MTKYDELFDRSKGIRLDVGCGVIGQKGFVGMDQFAHENVDIVHNVQDFPWPIPDNVCNMILMSHIWEHIEPKYRFQIMDECWRICRHDGQLFISCPYAGSWLEAAHPAHYMCPNEGTFQFFDPDYAFWHVCSYKKPLTWRLTRNDPNPGGCIEVVLEPRKDAKGKELPTRKTAVVPDAVKLKETSTKGE